jgi:hypothetical protein
VVPSRLIRTGALWAFLVATAIILWLADARTLVVVGVMALALLIAWAIEWAFWREERIRVVEVRDLATPEQAQEVAAARAGVLVRGVARALGAT